VVLRNSRHEQVLTASWNGALLAIVGFQYYSQCASEEKGLVSTYASNLDTFQAIARREDGLLVSASRDVGETQYHPSISQAILTNRAQRLGRGPDVLYDGRSWHSS